MALMLQFATVCFLVLAQVRTNCSHPDPKNWWMQKIADDFYVGGRPSRTHLKHLAETGIQSIVALENFKDPEDSIDVPPVAEEKEIVTKELGLQFATVIPDDSTVKWNSKEVFQLFGRVYPTLPKPMFFHCRTGYVATFISMSYFANQTKHDDAFLPKVTLKDVYMRGAEYGYQWHHDVEALRVSGIINSVLGQPDFELPQAQTSLPNFMITYWWARPIHGRYYVTGQIQADQFDKIKSAGFSTVVNLRYGDDFSPREEVTLLNVKDDTGANRQEVSNLITNRIDATRPNSYISLTSQYNFALTNPNEFGDGVGFSETRMRAAVQNSGLNYYHIPVDEGGLTAEKWRGVREKIINATASGNVLFSCRTGYRATLVALLLTAEQQRLNSSWALQKAEVLSRDIRPHQQLFADVLGEEIPQTVKDNRDNAATSLCRCPELLVTLLVLTLSRSLL